MNEDTEKQIELEKAKFNKPIYYFSQNIKKYDDIRAHMNLGENVQEKVKEASSQFFDEQYLDLIMKAKPNLKYY